MTGGGPGGRRVYLFDTGSHVMWAEEVALEEGIPVEIVPAPKKARDKCALALVTSQDQGAALEALLASEEIPFTLLP